MDEFAQTRGADDLFDDEFTPIAEPIVPSINPQPQFSQRGRSNHTPRKGNRAQDSFLRQTRQQAAPHSSESLAAAPTDRPLDQDANSPGEADPSASPHQETPQPQSKPPTAVRGDRTATGGTPKPKLTEEELSARLAAAKLNNAKRTEAHRIAEADEASFQQREAHASQKRKEEGQAKRIMNMEREKNRMRKLGAQAGREWDEGKEEVDRRDERGSQYRRGAHGGVMYEGGRGGRGRGYGAAVSEYQNDENSPDFSERRGGYRGRGQGDRGRARGRGRGRGRGSLNLADETLQAPPDPIADFPALPNNPKNIQASRGKPPDTPLGQTTGESWADEVQAAKASNG